MFDLSFEINGRKVNPKSFGNAIEAAMLSQIAESVKKSVGPIRCKEHGRGPKIIIKGRGLKDLSFEVSGCCEAVIEQVKQKLK